MLDLRSTIKITAVVLLVIGSALVASTVRHRQDRKHFLHALAEQGNELQQTKLQLQETRHHLVKAEKKLGFLNQHKQKVQLTAFIGQGSFANGVRTEQAYAVPHHALTQENVLNIALSPTARQNLRARMNDYIVLLDRQEQKTRLARFVDTTSADELRPVVDVFFAKQEEARLFGRQRYLAVNISTDDSPFREE